MMYLYWVDIWGPFASETEAMNRGQTPDNHALVIAPERNIANQVCYLVATKDARGQSNYQEIELAREVTACVLRAVDEPVLFEPGMVEELRSDPILPRLKGIDGGDGLGQLFGATCFSDSKEELCHFWIFAQDGLTANNVAIEYGSSLNQFDPDSEEIQVRLDIVEETAVFWNGSIVPFKTGKLTTSKGVARL